MGPILLCVRHSQPERECGVDMTAPPNGFGGQWAFFNCRPMRGGRSRVWLALAADRADSVRYEDAQLS